MAAVTIVCCLAQGLDVDGGNQRYEYQDRYLCMETTPTLALSPSTLHST